jgi:hypothetical protein
MANRKKMMRMKITKTRMKRMRTTKRKTDVVCVVRRVVLVRGSDA